MIDFPLRTDRLLRRTWLALACVVLASLTLAVAGLDPCFGLSLLLSSLIFCSVLLATFYWERSRERRAVRRIIEGSAIAHWEFTPEAWRSATTRLRDLDLADLRREWPRMRRGLCIAALPGFLTALVTAMPGILVAVGLGISFLAALLRLGQPALVRRHYRRLAQAPAEVYIASDSVLVGNEYFSWDGAGRELCAAQLAQSDGGEIELRWRTSIVPMLAPETRRLRIPVPASSTNEAKMVLTRLRQRIQGC